MKVFVLLRDEIDVPLDYSLGGVYSSFKKAEDAAMGRDGDWFIEEVILDKNPITPIGRAIEYLEEFGYKVDKGEINGKRT